MWQARLSVRTGWRVSAGTRNQSYLHLKFLSDQGMTAITQLVFFDILAKSAELIILAGYFQQENLDDADFGEWI